MMTASATYCNQTLVLESLDLNNPRKLMRLKIYLNKNSIFSFLINKSKLTLNFNILDENIISTNIIAIITFVEKLFDTKISFDDNLFKIIKESKNKKTSFYNSISELTQLKKNDFSVNKSFNEFCDFCNKTLQCKLRPYQYEASYCLTFGNGGFDFSVPGSGKTIIAYSTYNYFKSKQICDCILIIGPINSFNAWYDEYFTCFQKEPNFFSLANLSAKDSLVYLLSSESNHSEITFINIDKAWRFKKGIIEFIQNKKVLLIIDEAHKEKNPEAKITKAVLEITKYCNKRIILTGTPMPNGYEDLFALTKIYEPYEKILPYGYSELKRLTKNGASLEQRKNIMDSIKPIYSRVSKKFLLNTGELTMPISRFINCKLSSEQLEIYNFLNKFSFNIDNDIESAINVSMMRAVLIRKMQTSANPGLLSKSIINTIEEYKKEYYEEFEVDNSNSEMLVKADKILKEAIASSSIAKLVSKFDSFQLVSPKNEAAVNLALELTSVGEKVILWDVFIQNMDTLKHMISRRYSGKVEIINGSVFGEERQNAINNFKNGKCMILIANPTTLAESISLHTCCQHAIYVNRNYNAAQFIQSKDRIHRINMPKGKTANYYFLINENTVDEEVNERLNIKEKRMLEILDSDELKICGNDFENNSFMSLRDIISSYKK